MTHATITITDTEGGVHVATVYEGGHNPLAQSHQIADALVAHMHDLGEPVGEPVHLNADEVAAMKANKLLTPEGATVVAQNRAQFDKLMGREAALADGDGSEAD